MFLIFYFSNKTIYLNKTHFSFILPKLQKSGVFKYFLLNTPFNVEIKHISFIFLANFREKSDVFKQFSLKV